MTNWKSLINFLLSYCLFRVLGRLVLIPFLEGRRSPNGIEAQEMAETEAESIFGKASSAIGMMVGLNRAVNYICNTRSRKVSCEMPDLYDRCIKNYALLICFAEKVTYFSCLN